MFYLYIIKSLDERQLYVGVSKNPKQRLFYHNEKRGAKFTKRKQFKIVFLEQHPTLTSARLREIQIKKWSRKKKEILVNKFNK